MEVLTRLNLWQAARCVKRRRREFLRAVLALPAFLGAFAGIGMSSSTEYQIKAAYLYNFALFVEWPPQKLPPSPAPVIIGVLGEDPFGSDLEKTIRNEKVRGRPIVTRRSQRLSELLVCHIVFVSASERPRMTNVLDTLTRERILSVGESDDFCARGGMIRFFKHGNRVRIEVNPAAARTAGLKVSSELLSVGKIFDGETR